MSCPSRSCCAKAAVAAEPARSGPANWKHASTPKGKGSSGRACTDHIPPMRMAMARVARRQYAPALRRQGQAIRTKPTRRSTSRPHDSLQQAHVPRHQTRKNRQYRDGSTRPTTAATHSGSAYRASADYNSPLERSGRRQLREKSSDPAHIDGITSGGLCSVGAADADADRLLPRVRAVNQLQPASPFTSLRRGTATQFERGRLPP